MIDLPLTTLLDSFPEPVLLCDEDGLVLTANTPALRLFRMTLEEMAEAPADTWLHDAQGLLWPRLGETVTRDLRFRDGDGTQRNASGEIQPMPIDGSMGWVIRLENPAGHGQKLQGLESMAGGIAAELSTRVTTILDNASALLMGPLEESTATRVRAILTAAEHAATLQRQLRAVAGQGEDRAPGHLSKVLTESETLLESVLGERIALELDCDEEGDDVLATGDASAGQPAGHDLGVRGEVRCDAPALLRAAGRDGSGVPTISGPASAVTPPHAATRDRDAIRDACSMRMKPPRIARPTPRVR